jgi:hypothetical protein
MRNLVVSSWFTITEGCPMRYNVNGSNDAHVVLGDTEIELGFDAAALRAFVDMGAAMLAEMDTQYEREEAEAPDPLLGNGFRALSPGTKKIR